MQRHYSVYHIPLEVLGLSVKPVEIACLLTGTQCEKPPSLKS